MAPGQDAKQETVAGYEKAKLVLGGKWGLLRGKASMDPPASWLPRGLPGEYTEVTVVFVMQGKLEGIKLKGFTNKLA